MTHLLTSNRRTSSLVILFCGASILLSVSASRAAVDRSPTKLRITISHSDKYPSLYFVVCNFPVGPMEPLPWDRVDVAKAKFFPSGSGFECPTDGRVFVVLAVPRATAEKAKGKPDPGWLKPTAPGVIRVAQPLKAPSRPPTRDVTLNYRLDKTPAGPTLTLLNPEALKLDPKSGPTPVSESMPKSERPRYTWLYFAGAGALLVVLLAVLFLKHRGAVS